MHGLEHLDFLTLGKLSVDLSAALILALTELSVLGDNFLALVGPPDLVVKLLLLVALVLNQINNHGLALLEL